MIPARKLLELLLACLLTGTLMYGAWAGVPAVPVKGGSLLMARSAVVTPTPMQTWYVQITGAYVVLWAPTPTGPWEYATNVSFPAAAFTLPVATNTMFFRGVWRTYPCPVVVTNAPAQ